MNSHLWVFVSKFTEFDATHLHKLYKHAVKKRELVHTSGGTVKEEKASDASAETSSHSEHRKSAAKSDKDNRPANKHRSSSDLKGDAREKDRY